TGYLAGLAAEEITAHAILSGGEAGSGDPILDVRVTASDRTLVLRVRDNGQAFNLSSLSRMASDAGDPGSNFGVRMICSLADRIDYYRVYGMNTTIIRITDGPIVTLEEVEELPTGQIGELMVTGPQITREYVTRTEANALAKVHEKLADGSDRIWHRMGDVGYFDEKGRFWFCGRKAHRVETTSGTLFSVCCEAIFNQHPDVNRSALVGIPQNGLPEGKLKPVIIIEPKNVEILQDDHRLLQLRTDLQILRRESPLTEDIQTIMFHPNFPVDIRHNAKIFREKLAVWAAKNITEMLQ
ncbi:MAG: AMP-binding protein, partial [Thermoguttaceae bacterium]|nr:AMP-binding protein [Thermoguttaceae bacterium]